MKADKIRYIESDIEYVLTRPNLYIGSTQKNQIETYLMEECKFVKKQIEYIPAFLKIFDEILTNSVDEAIKTNFKYANKIEVNIDVYGRIVLSDNGRGLSSEIEENTKLPQAVIAFTKLKAGSNFDGDRIGAGQNGVGASLVNIFSKEFDVETSDGIKKTSLHCENNLSKSEYSQRKNSQRYTTVSYLPDYERLNMTQMDSVHFALIEKRVINMALCFPEITFVFNGKKINKCNLKEYVKMFDADPVIFSESTENVDIAIVPFQNETETISFVNGVDTTKHGQHLTVFNSLLNKALKDNKKTAEITLAQFLTNCKVFIILKKIKNASFSAQIKDELTNTFTEIKDYFNIDFEKLLSSMLRNKEFYEAVKGYSDAIKNLNDRKLLEKDEKKLKKLKVAKFIAPISSNLEYCNFYICEGDSAIGQLINVRNNFTAGYPLRGKVINPRTSSAKKLLENENMRDLIALLGLKLSSPSIENFKYRAIYILTDQDTDGDCIAAQLLNIFYTYWPDLIKSGKVYRVLSPLIIAKHNTTKELKHFYSLTDFHENQLNYSILEYNKGLGSLSREEYQKLIDNPNLIKFSDTDTTEAKLQMLFGKNADERKDWLNGEDDE
jgi:DNA gyrase/topoisomerase IV subunit B